MNPLIFYDLLQPLFSFEAWIKSRFFLLHKQKGMLDYASIYTSR